MVTALPPLALAKVEEPQPSDAAPAAETQLPFLPTKWSKASNIVKILVAFNAEAKKSYRGAFGGLRERWDLPAQLLCLKEDRRGTSTQDWVPRDVALHGTFLSAVVEPATDDLHKFCDCQGVIFVDLRDPLLGAKAPNGVFPWTLELRGGERIVLAAKTSEDRHVWVSCIKKVSGCKVDDGINKYRRAESPTAERMYAGGNQVGARSERGEPHREMLRSFKVKHYHDASKFTGQFEAGLWNNFGRLQHGIGDVYDGEWMNGLKHGLGSLTYACGDIYEGSFLEGKRHGSGKYYHFSADLMDADQRFRLAQHLQYGAFLPKTMKLLLDNKRKMDHYTGPWKNDKRHGTGILTENARAEPVRYHVVYYDGKLIEKINLKEMEAALLPHDLQYSQEEMVAESGVKFAPNLIRTIGGRAPFTYTVEPELPEGIQLDEHSGEITGAGEKQQPHTWYTITAQNSLGKTTAQVSITILEAPFESGYHERTYDDGSVYRGEWLRGLWHGKGELLLAGGQTYFGGWKEGLKHGHGTLAGLHGVMYDGEYSEGQRSGWGTATFATGERYEGGWEADQRHGVGTLFRSDGTAVHGRWERGAATADVEEQALVVSSQSMSCVYQRKPLQLRATTGWKEPWLSDVRDYELHPDIANRMLDSVDRLTRWQSFRQSHKNLAALASDAASPAGGAKSSQGSIYQYSNIIRSRIIGPAKVSRLLSHME